MDKPITVVPLLTWLLAGCVVLPIPTPEWGKEPISREQYDALEEGIGMLSRTDIKAMLGSPQQSYAEGQVIVYEWTRKQGIWIVGVATAGAIGAGDSEHRLCLLFDEQGVLEETRHIDSALFMADSMVANQLEAWLATEDAGETAPGYSTEIDPDSYGLVPRAAPVIGVMLYSEGEKRPSCWNELESFAVAGYALYMHEELRDAFYPWLEPPWLNHLPVLSAGPALAVPRKETRLRFIIVVSSENSLFDQSLCETRNPFTASCYDIAYRHQRGQVAVLDLDTDPRPAPPARSGIETLSIPVFPESRHETCRSLMAYAASDIERLADH